MILVTQRTGRLSWGWREEGNDRALVRSAAAAAQVLEESSNLDKQIVVKGSAGAAILASGEQRLQRAVLTEDIQGTTTTCRYAGPDLLDPLPEQRTRTRACES